MPTKEEFNKILLHTPPDWPAFILTNGFAGLRSSEMRGLPWVNVDFSNSVIHVTQRADRWGKIGSPKSEAGTREIEVPPAVIKALREWKVRCPKGELDLVFPNGIGRVESHSNIMNRFFYPTQIVAGVTKKVILRDKNRKPVLDADGRSQMVVRAKFGLHAIRHFCASLWIEAGFSPKKVQALMGHKSIVQTFDTYGYLFERRDQDHAKVRKIQRSVLGR
jgi:integrase